VTLLRAHDLRTEQLIARKVQETEQQMFKLADDYRIIMKKHGYNVMILPKAQDLAELQERGYPTQTMPETDADRLATGHIVTLNHMLPILEQRITWPERRCTMILAGIRGQITSQKRGEEKPEYGFKKRGEEKPEYGFKKRGGEKPDYGFKKRGAEGYEPGIKRRGGERGEGEEYGARKRPAGKGGFGFPKRSAGAGFEGGGYKKRTGEKGGFGFKKRTGGEYGAKEREAGEEAGGYKKRAGAKPGFKKSRAGEGGGYKAKPKSAKAQYGKKRSTGAEETPFWVSQKKHKKG
jgi:hypothetical protein